MELEQLMWQEGWTPTTDLEVSLLMKIIAEKEKDARKIVESADEEIDFLRRQQDEACRKFSSYQDRINYLLSNYVLNEVDEDDKKETKTQIKYALARGTIVVSKPIKKLEKPTDEITIAEKFPEFVQQIPKLQWAELKKNLEIDENGQVIDKRTGQVVDGIPVSEAPQAVAIKLND